MNEEKNNSQLAADNLQNNEESISSDEAIVNAEQPPIINSKPQIEEMEVHHHTHSHGKKNWKQYFWFFSSYSWLCSAG